MSVDRRLQELVPALTRIDEDCRISIIAQARYDFFVNHATWRTHLAPWAMLVGLLTVVVVAPMTVWRYLRLPLDPFFDVLLLALLVAVTVYCWSHLQSRWLSSLLAPVVRELVSQDSRVAGSQPPSPIGIKDDK